MKPVKNCHFIYPSPYAEASAVAEALVDRSGKARIPHLLRCQGFAVKYYSFTLGVLDLAHPHLLQR